MHKIAAMKLSRPFVAFLLFSLVAGLAATRQPELAAQGPAEQSQSLQITQASPGLAPALGQWTTSPRGQFETIEARPNALTIRATVTDPDTARPAEFEILVDGNVAMTGRAPIPPSIGEEVVLERTVPVTPGVHEICLRLADPDNPARTVHCQDAVTTPPNRADAGLEASAQGVVVSPSGVVVPVVGGSTNNWSVLTPCGATSRLSEGTFIDRARVVIDPGHGGSESGAVSGDLLEKQLNLVISDLVIDKFEALGIPAQITRTGDYRVPIGTRADIADALAPDVFISIHHNGGAVRRASTPGTEIFYSEVRPESQRLAAILYETMHAAANQFEADWVDTVNRGASVRLNENGDDLFGIHRFTPQIDSIITEFAYLSNPSEAALLRRADVQEAQAQSIVDGVLQWWFTNDAGTSLGRRFTDPSSSGTGGFDNCLDPSLASGTVGTYGLSNLDEQRARSLANR